VPHDLPPAFPDLSDQCVREQLLRVGRFRRVVFDLGGVVLSQREALPVMHLYAADRVLHTMGGACLSLILAGVAKFIYGSRL
jgi:hypothetical protein